MILSKTVVSVFSPIGDQALRAPQNLTAIPLSATQVRLSWTYSGGTPDGYRIERSTDGVNFTEIDTAAYPSLTYDDSGSSVLYYYQIRAYKGTANSEYSNLISIDLALIVALLSSFSFDEASGNLIDEWGSDDGVPTGATQGAVGKISSAYSFAGAGKVMMSESRTLLATDSFTFDFWYKPRSLTGSFYIVDRTLNIFTVIQIYQTNKDLSFRIRGSNNVGITTVTYTNAFPYADEWYHIICERNVGSDNINITVNGVTWATPVTDATTSGFGPITFRLASAQQDKYYVNGLIDEMRLWKGVFSAANKAKLYNSGYGKKVLSSVDYSGAGLSANKRPTGLAVQWIDDYAKIDFTDGSSGSYQHEIWESRNDEPYTLVTTLSAGVVTYNHKTWQNAKLNYKVRAISGYLNTAFTDWVQITSPLVFKMNQATLTAVAITDIHLYATGKTMTIYWGDGTNTPVTAVTTNPINKSYSVTGQYFVRLTGDVKWINFLQWSNAAAQLAGTDISKWILPEYLQAVHLNDNGMIGNMTGVRYNDRLTYFDINNNDLEWNLSNFYLPPLLFEFNAITSDPSKLTGDISNMILPDPIAHLNIQGNATGDLTNFRPFINATYGTLNLLLKSYYGSGFFGDLSLILIPDSKPTTISCTTGCHFNKLPRGHFRYVSQYEFTNNSCDSAEVDAILAYIDSYFTSGVVPLTNITINLSGSGMGAPSSAGLTSKASIESKYVAAGYVATITVN